VQWLRDGAKMMIKAQLKKLKLASPLPDNGVYLFCSCTNRV
jgi:hypothetical protein